jgi:cell division protein FtsN
MSEKPSLYVVEKKEVIILVVLFVLVTVLSFTLGVRYGESVGKKAAHEQAVAEREQGGEGSDSGAGTLGKGGHSDQAGSLEKPEGAAPKADGEHAPATAERKTESKSPEGKKEETGEAEANKGASPEDAAKHSANVGATHEAVDKNSDEYLLNALKDAGVEPPGGKAPRDAKLPESVKETAAPAASKSATRAKSGTYVIQVGSHPTQAEAESQLRSLKSHRVSAEILPPFRDKQGEWHRVVIGGFKSKRDAEKEATGLKGKGSIVSYFVWRLP